jgi:membrane protease YdiL (CAAX protease family)
MGGIALANPVRLPPGDSPATALPLRPRAWTWTGALLLLGAVFGLQFVAVYLAGTALAGLSRLGVTGLHDWALPALGLVASLTTLALLLSQRRRMGARPLWDWQDLQDWRGWLRSAAVLGGCALANLLRVALTREAATPALNQEVLDLAAGAAAVRWMQLGTIAVTIVVLAPLTEEWLFRGILQPALAERWGEWVAIPATALLFGLMHGLDVWWVPAIYGAALGLLSRRQRSLLLPMVVHGLINVAVLGLLLTAA